MATFRTRTQHEPSAAGRHKVTYFNWPAPVPVAVDAPVAKPHAFTQTTDDYVVPNYRKLSAQGVIFNNPFASTRQWYASSGNYIGEGYLSTTNDVPDPAKGWNRHEWLDGSFFEAGFVPFLAEPSIDIASLLAQAQTQAAANVNQSDIMALVSAAEWHKTKVLHRQVGSAILNVFKGIYSRKGVVRNTSKALADAWMTGRYAVMPLLYELEGARKLFSRQAPKRFTARGQSSQVLQNSQNFVFSDSHGWVLTFSLEIRREVTTRSGILYETEDLFRLLGGIGATRPLSAVYELTKFSWMLDWWIDVGTWLDAMQPDGSSNFLAAWTGYKDVVTHTASLVSLAQTGGTPQSRMMSKSRSMSGSRVKVIERRVRNTWPGNPPIVPPPGRGLNNLRCADMISVVVQKLGYKRGGYVSGIRF